MYADVYLKKNLRFSVMSCPQEPIRMKINLTTGSSRLNGSTEFDEEGLSPSSLGALDDQVCSISY